MINHKKKIKDTINLKDSFNFMIHIIFFLLFICRNPHKVMSNKLDIVIIKIKLFWKELINNSYRISKNKIDIRNIVLESDSQILITTLREDSYSLASFGHLVKDIQFIASYLSSINYIHVIRQCNALAHSLARRAKSLSQSQVWMKDVPPDSSIVLHADLFGLL